MPVEVKAYSKKQIADMYKISVKVLRKWLSPAIANIGPYNGKLYTPKQVQAIFDHLGEP